MLVTDECDVGDMQIVYYCYNNLLASQLDYMITKK